MNTLESFLREMRNTFKLPDYYSENLNSLGECLNDLEWIDKPNYLFIIKNSNSFLKSESPDLKNDVLQFLNRVSQEWANVPNFKGEELYRGRADFQIKLVPEDAWPGKA